jgi:DNA-binding transcriptional regulator YiaG
MANIATILKSEITRVARREVHAEMKSLKKANAQYRSAIAQLRRELADVQKQVKEQGRQAAKLARQASAATSAGGLTSAGTAGSDGEGIARRFSANRLAAHRAKLEISAASYGRLLGVSDQTIYNWEQGKSRPDVQQLHRVAAVRALGKRDVAERLATVAAPPQRARKTAVAPSRGRATSAR